jgi:Fic family protein
MAIAKYRVANMVTSIQLLPLPNIETWETRAVLKKAAQAQRALAELKGMAETIPNEEILINTLALQEAKHSSEIENIVTTHDELYKADLFAEGTHNPAAKEVKNYVVALKCSFALVREQEIIRLSDILKIQETLEAKKSGLRKLPGTALKNGLTGEVIYTPPQHPDEILWLMDNLIQYMNDDAICEADPLVKMAIIHHQFESIHPFYDGNGRTGRILNMLYLVIQNLLDLPILYLSRYLIQTKSEYYRLLQSVRDTGEWEPWLLYMLEGVYQTAHSTMALIGQMKALMQSYKRTMREKCPKIYRQDLLNNLFNHPYTKIDFIMNELNVGRLTASRYLEELVAVGLLQKAKIGRSNYYMNSGLMALFMADA